MKEVTLKVKGLTWNPCEHTVREAARKFSEVQEIVEMSPAKGLARFVVKDDVSATSLAESVSNTGTTRRPWRTKAAVSRLQRGRTTASKDVLKLLCCVRWV